MNLDLKISGVFEKKHDSYRKTDLYGRNSEITERKTYLDFTQNMCRTTDLSIIFYKKRIRGGE